GDGAVGDPVGVVVLLRDRVVLRLGSAGVAAALGVEPTAPEEREVALAFSGVVRVEPLTIMVAAEGAVHGELHVLEATPGAGRAPAGSGPCRGGRCDSRRARGGTPPRTVRRPGAGRRWRTRRGCARTGR